MILLIFFSVLFYHGRVQYPGLVFYIPYWYRIFLHCHREPKEAPERTVKKMEQGTESKGHSEALTGDFNIPAP
ncbi:hypothetical protein B9Z19DRAFT_1080037 [Tuber borchii]|uniref:Uncharacterized protein n=1 Tax=Tuber borchii TaxID=42251 RepID=A0A2T6ZXC4_TUBBO|nr:hypothetical protein B9Z19DRAFT_1080037 [Tuber borchii]